MRVLGIETSCDETAAAVIRGGREVLSNIVASQVDVHARYGGVVPELASRKHVEAVSVVIDAALETAGVDLGEIEGIGVTRVAHFLGVRGRRIAIVEYDDVPTHDHLPFRL